MKEKEERKKKREERRGRRKQQREKKKKEEEPGRGRETERRKGKRKRRRKLFTIFKPFPTFFTKVTFHINHLKTCFKLKGVIFSEIFVRKMEENNNVAKPNFFFFTVS
jgi:hypothetical protein